MNIIENILQWPVIIQGALGSFLFWLVFFLLGKIFKFLIETFGKFSNEFKQFSLTLEWHQRSANITNGADKTYHISVCNYSALYFCMRGLIFVTISLIISDYLAPFHLIGYFIAIYYFFRASISVQVTFGDKIDDNDRIKEIDEEIEKLEKS